jgi:hypothetical protein
MLKQVHDDCMLADWRRIGSGAAANKAQPNPGEKFYRKLSGTECSGGWSYLLSYSAYMKTF